MWLLSAVGPVHGQERFTFALEQKKSYTVGRGKDCAIRLEDNRVRPLQGSVTVADWDPTHPDKPPALKWKSEPSKKGVYPPFKTILPVDPDAPPTNDLEQYDDDELSEGTQGCFLHDNPGQGILLSEGSWFTVTWEAVSICYDKMGSESDEMRETLRRYCIAWTQTFETSSPPTLVLSQTFKNTTECNSAVVSAIRILTPLYLQGIINRLNACWKKIADSQDSFSLPALDDTQYEPDFDPALTLARREREMWLPDEKRKTLFSGWKIMGLRSKIAPAEKRWMIAMGAEYTEIDITRPAPKDPAAFRQRLEPWLSTINKEAGDKGLVVHFMKVKEDLRKAGGDFDEVVSSTCSELGLYVASGAICWGAARKNGVQEYLESLGAKSKPSDPAATAMPPPSLPPLPAQAGPSQTGPSSTAATARPDFVPSTFPDETPGPRPGRVAPAAAAASVATVAETPGENSSGESQEQRTFKKPLRKRAAGVSARKVDLFADLSMDSSMDLPPEQPSLPPTQRAVESQSLNNPASSQAPARSKLKRRAGAADTQPSQFDFGFDSSYYAEQQNIEKQEEIRRLYEETKAETAASIDTRSKRPRITSPSKSPDAEVVETVRSTRTSRRTVFDPDGDEAMIEDDDEAAMEDPMQRMLRQAREAKLNRNVSNPTTGSAGPSRGRTTQLLSEEPEEVEPRPAESSRAAKSEPSPVKPKTKAGAKQKDAGTSNEPTKDQNFLTAIKTASKKAKIDEMDEEFNNLRILKPSKAKVQVQPLDHPDWNMVEGFDDEMTGNFIQIVKLDLFRKDGGNKRVERVDDGKPNFKKFKKKNVVRREPLNLVVAAPTIEDAEMGEAYWPTQQTKLPRRTQASQMQNSLEDEDELPLLPRSKKKRLLELEDDDDSTPFEVASTSAATARQAPLASKATNSRATGRPTRKTRAASIISDVSSVAASTRSARAKPLASRARGKKEVIEIQDSEDEVALDLGKTPAGSGRGTGTGTASGSGGTRGTRGRGATSTLEGDPTSTRSTRTPAFDTGTTTSRKTGTVTGTQGKTATAATEASSGTARGARRRLVVDDDEDDTKELTQRGITKKRRL